MKPDHCEDTTESGRSQHQGDGQGGGLGVGAQEEGDLSDQGAHRETQAVWVMELHCDVDEYNLKRDGDSYQEGNLIFMCLPHLLGSRNRK